MNTTTADTTTETNLITPESATFAIGMIIGCAGTLIGAQVLYKRYIKKVPPLATGE